MISVIHDWKRRRGFLSRIENNTSIIEIREQINGVKEFLGDKKLLNKMGITPVQRMRLSSQFKKIERELTSLSTLPDNFNNIFTGTGWIAYESLKVEII